MQTFPYLRVCGGRLEYEQHRDLQAPIAVLEEEMKAGQKELASLAQKMSALQEERDALQAQLEAIQANVEGTRGCRKVDALPRLVSACPVPATV